jgi:hypothetical protein
MHLVFHGVPVAFALPAILPAAATAHGRLGVGLAALADVLSP